MELSDLLKWRIVFLLLKESCPSNLKVVDKFQRDSRRRAGQEKGWPGPLGYTKIQPVGENFGKGHVQWACGEPKRHTTLRTTRSSGSGPHMLVGLLGIWDRTVNSQLCGTALNHLSAQNSYLGPPTGRQKAISKHNSGSSSEPMKALEERAYVTLPQPRN